MYAKPRTSTLDVSGLPVPDGWAFFNFINPYDIVQDGKHYPVLYFGPYIYTALSSGNDDNSMEVVCWDAEGNFVKGQEYKGAQYIACIMFDAETQTVMFIGQSERFIRAHLDDLVVHPTVIRISHDSCSTLRIPPTLTYASGHESFSPGLSCGPYTFLPLSYTNGRNSICVAVVHNTLIERVIECPGIHTIQEIYVDENERTILFYDRDIDDGVCPTRFDYDTALACYHYSYFITKDDFLFFAQDLGVPLSYADTVSLENAMPPFNCALHLEMVANARFLLPKIVEEKNAQGSATVGAMLGGFLGGLCGSLVGGPCNSGLGAIAGTMAGIEIGESIPSSSDLVQYELSDQEKEQSLVSYPQFPCGPFNTTGVQEYIFDCPFRRYQDHPYSAALIPPSETGAPRAYSPATRADGPLPCDPRYQPLRLKNGIHMMKYSFVIIKTNETDDGGYQRYQMRIHPNDFLFDLWRGTQRVNHIQLSEGYRFWALIGHPDTEVYAAGTLYVDATNKTLFGIDTTAGHYFRTFMDQDQQVNDATIEFLGKLGYPTSGMKDFAGFLVYMKEHMRDGIE